MNSHERTLCDSCLCKQYKDFQHDCLHELIDKNKVWGEHYGIGTWPRWDYEMKDATLIFSEGGKAKVVCEMQVVGTTQGDSWEWSWGNSNLPTECRWRMDEVRDFGEQKQWEKLTTLFLKTDEYLGWECCAVATHIFDGIAAYRGPNSDRDGAVWMVVLSCSFVN